MSGIGPWHEGKTVGGMDHGNDSQKRLCDDEETGKPDGNFDGGSFGFH